MSLFENDNYDYRDTFFVLFENHNRPGGTAVKTAIEQIADNYELKNLREVDGTFESVTIISPHACSDTSLEILVDVCACHPTATTYITNYALSGPGQCGAGAIVIENRKIGLNKERLKARTGYAFNAFGAETYGSQLVSEAHRGFAKSAQAVTCPRR